MCDKLAKLHKSSHHYDMKLLMFIKANIDNASEVVYEYLC